MVDVTIRSFCWLLEIFSFVLLDGVFFFMWCLPTELPKEPTRNDSLGEMIWVSCKSPSL